MSIFIEDWPQHLCPAEAEWHLQMPIARSTSAFDGSARDSLIGPPRWAFTVQPPNSPRHSLRATEWEAFVRRQRAGLNRVRAWDWRRRPIGGNGRPAAPRQPLNLIPNSVGIASWARVGPAGVASGGGVQTSATSDYYSPLGAPYRAGARHVLAADLLAAAEAHVAVSFDATAMGGEPAGAIFNAHTGAVVSTYGTGVDIDAGHVAGLGGAFRCWVSAVAQASVPGLVHLYPILPITGAVSVFMARPQVDLSAPLDPYTPTTGTPAYTGLAPQVDGAGQTGARLHTTGWLPNQTLRGAYPFGVNGEYKQLLQTVVTDADGNAELWFEPPLRRSPADGALLQIDRPSALFRLVTEAPAFRQRAGVDFAPALTFIEDITTEVTP